MSHELSYALGENKLVLDNFVLAGGPYLWASFEPTLADNTLYHDSNDGTIKPFSYVAGQRFHACDDEHAYPPGQQTHRNGLVEFCPMVDLLFSRDQTGQGENFRVRVQYDTFSLPADQLVDGYRELPYVPQRLVPVEYAIGYAPNGDPSEEPEWDKEGSLGQPDEKGRLVGYAAEAIWASVPVLRRLGGFGIDGVALDLSILVADPS